MDTIRFIGEKRNFSDIQECGIEECVEYCSSRSILGLDTETTGLDHIGNKVVMLQIGDKERQFVIDARVQSLKPLKQILESENILKILHNAKFDYKFIRNEGIVLERVWDTMLVEQVYHCGRNDIRFGLGALCDRHLGIELKKDVRNQFIRLDGRPYTDAQIVYGAKDIEYLLDIREKQIPLIKQRRLGNVVSLENAVVLAFADMEFEGMDINSEAWRKVGQGVEVDMKASEKRMDEIVANDQLFSAFVPAYVQGDLFGDPVRKVAIQWSSPTQTLKLFKKVVPTLESVNGKDLYLHRSKHPLIALYVKYKEQAKVVSSYGEAFLKNLRADGKIHTDFKQILNTGRVSSANPNMQQVPADNIFRNCFTASEGEVFVSSDFSSQELNVIAYGSQDPVWLEALKNGHDLHSVCAELIFKKKWTDAAEEDCLYTMKKEKCECKAHKKQRTQVKSINFMLAYGGGAGKLSELVEIPLPEAKALIQEYFKEFPSIKGFLQKLGQFGVDNGYAETYAPFKRRREFPGWNPKLRYVETDSVREFLSTIERASKNSPIQGSSADMTKYALVKIRKFINTHKLPVKLLLTVHDQVDTIAKEDFAETWKVELTKLMEDAALVVIPNGLLKADTTISKCWQK